MDKFKQYIKDHDLQLITVAGVVVGVTSLIYAKKTVKGHRIETVDYFKNEDVERIIVLLNNGKVRSFTKRAALAD